MLLKRSRSELSSFLIVFLFIDTALLTGLWVYGAIFSADSTHVGSFLWAASIITMMLVCHLAIGIAFDKHSHSPVAQFFKASGATALACGGVFLLNQIVDAGKLWNGPNIMMFGTISCVAKMLLVHFSVKQKYAIAADAKILIIGSGTATPVISLFGLKDHNTEILDTYGAKSDNELVREIRNRLKSHSIDEIWFFGVRACDASIMSLVSEIDGGGQQIKHLSLKTTSPPSGIIITHLTPYPLSFSENIVKTYFDKLFAVVALTMLAPFLGAIAIAVKLSSPGPIIYKQTRLTQGKRPFSIYKFRTMPVNAESNGPVWSKSNEIRSTSFGAFLRRTSMDELPQFFNVLKGDMSVVGPRPERPFFVSKFEKRFHCYALRHCVNAGITGWAQVNGFRGNTDLVGRVSHDVEYIRDWSPWFDIKVIFYTIFPHRQKTNHREQRPHNPKR
ncbi:MAG: exopolysaccharide biosynthesis polyprenyl glycosylphosphotransferase [Gammaproteobacteria bacterium]|nr:exopolysaccharide biosynthesis polyprenyl glycosylphosphotransferase [Gammaproteobacteria bacterium]